MNRLLLISLCAFLTAFIFIGASLIYLRYGGEDHLMPSPIRVVDQ